MRFSSNHDNSGRCLFQLVKHITRLMLLAVPLAACGGEFDAEKISILERDSRNSSVEFDLYTNGKNLVYCVINLSDGASAMDVFRVFLHTAEKLKDRPFEMVNLCFRKETRFVLDGDDFVTIGQELETQNPMYTIRTFPEKLLLPDGTRAYEERRGGMIYLMNAQMGDFNDMNGKWYMNELAAEIKARTDALRPKEFASDEEVF